MRRAWAERRLGGALVAAAVLALAAPRAAHAVTVRLTGDWSEAERAAIAAALAGLPEVVRGKLSSVVARDAENCDADGFPDDGRLVDAGGDVHLCARGGDAPTVARQVVTALLFGFDRAVAWSEEPAWRRLSRWRASLASGLRPRPENVSPTGFASPRGRRSPRWDLTTFLAATWLEPAKSADGIACRLLSQAAFVRERLGALAGAPVPAAACAAYEAWADLERLADVEIVLAAPSTAMVGSLFGHVFLRLVYRDDSGETPPHLSRTVAFLADNDVPFEVDRGYALKGIAGFYTASLHERTFLETFREYAVTEGRDLRRWRVALTPPERGALLQRLWTVLGGGQYAYYFFRQNCATLMMELLDDARDPSRAVDGAGLLAAPPASTLEAWAEARALDGSPLLVYVPEPVLSFAHEARSTSRHRRRLEPALLARADGGRREALADTFRGAHAADAQTRAAAYDRLALLLDGFGDDGARAWLRDSAGLEAHLSVLANLEAEARADLERRARARRVRDDLRARLLLAGGAPGRAAALVSDEEPETRLVGYRALRALVEAPARSEEEKGRLRLLALLESEVRYDVFRLKREPALRDALLFADLDRVVTEQPYLAGHADLIELPVVTRVGAPLRALQRSRVALLAKAGPATAVDAPADAGLVATREEYDASLHRSGIDQTAVEAGVLAGPAVATGALVLGGALYDERLGDHRRFGFPSDTAFVVGRSELWLAWPASGERLPKLAAYDARVLGYRSLRLPLPEADARRWPVGWELFVDLRGSAARALGAEASAGWGALLPVLDRGELADHLLAGLGVAYVAAFPSAPASGPRQALALPLSLELRAALGARPAHRSWVAARLLGEPLAVVGSSGARGFATTESAEVELHVALRPSTARGRHDPALLLRARALRTSLTMTGARDELEAALSLGVELR